MLGFEKDKGLGDTVARMTHTCGIDKAAEWFAHRMGWPDCGCSSRQARLNSVYPYQRATLSVCIPTRDDWYGFWATWHALSAEITALNLMNQVELVVLDQGDADSEQSKMVANTVRTATRAQRLALVDGQRREVNVGGLLRAKYVNKTDIRGTAVGKMFSILHATGDWCIVLDSHVILETGCIPRMLKWINKRANRFARGMFHGVLTGDDYVGAYQYLDAFDPQGVPIIGDDGVFGRWHPKYDPRTDLRNGKPFVIPAGAGWCFAVNRAWFSQVGYHPLMRGFGGEEGSQALRMRKHGGEVYCHPGLRGTHRFGITSHDRANRQYGNTDQEKLRNQVISWLDAERDIEELRTAWRKRIPMHLIEPTIQQTIKEFQDWRSGMDQKIAAQKQSAEPPKLPQSLPELFERYCKEPSDINEHLGTLRTLASECQHVTEFGTRGGVSTVALLAGGPQTVASYDVVNICGEGCSSCQKKRMPCLLATLVTDTNIEWHHGVDTSTLETIDDTDLLLIDTLHTADQVRSELKHAGQVRRFIVLHDTVTFGETGEGGAPGILVAVREFLDANPQWFIRDQYINNNGLMVLARKDD